jgi:hypothetical protein
MLLLLHRKIWPNTIIAVLKHIITTEPLLRFESHNYTTKQNYHDAVKQPSLHNETELPLRCEAIIITLRNRTTITLWNNHYTAKQNYHYAVKRSLLHYETEPLLRFESHNYTTK